MISVRFQGKPFSITVIQLYAIYGCHHMVNTEMSLIISFAAEDGEAVYSQQKKK